RRPRKRPGDPVRNPVPASPVHCRQGRPVRLEGRAGQHPGRRTRQTAREKAQMKSALPVRWATAKGGAIPLDCGPSVTDMTEREAFLQAIRADPDDDLLRLVFADWLDEQGEHEPADFIRVQCELEPVRHRLESQRTRELIRLEEVAESYRFGTALEFD